MLINFKKSLRFYLENISGVLGFALLFIFVVFFLGFNSVFVSSGSMFLDYLSIEKSSQSFLLFLIGFLAYLFFYSAFVVLMVFSIRNYLSTVKLNYYITDKIRKFALKYFVFLLVFSVLSYAVIYLFSVVLGLKFLGFLLLAVFFCFFLFLPQSIVIDEESLFSSIQNNLEFSRKNPRRVFAVFFSSLVFFYFVVLLEFVLNYFFVPGEFVSMLIVVLFIIPFMEVLKTVYYMEKFGLVKRTSLAFS